MRPTYLFIREYLRPRDGVVEVRELEYARGAESLPATLYLPAVRRRTLPGWIVLHGLTYSGRQHRSLVPFARALAASGSAVLIPEIPEWRRLRVAPDLTGPTIAAAAASLAGLPEVDGGRIGVMGFSFGATQALVASRDPEMAGRIGGIAAWGGYCDLDRLFLFGLTGEHDLDGVAYRSDPDPYGRWIMMGNYLTRVPGLEDHPELAEAALELALESGRRGFIASHPVYDPIKESLRERLPEAQRPLFDVVAPVSGRPRGGDQTRARELALELAAAARGADPLLDASPHLGRVTVRTRIAHGRGDQLVPFTEAYRLQRALPANACEGCTISSLFGHSEGAAEPVGIGGRAAEAIRFAALMNAILRLP